MVTIGGLPVYDALVMDDDCGMVKISLVDDPAVMSDFQAFDNARRMQMYSVMDEEKRLVRGVVMRADFPIYRRDERLGEYYIIYKAETIRRMAEKYLADGLQNEVSTMHKTDVDGVQMVQYFIKGDGVSVTGFDDIADGSLFAEFHVLNDEVWEAVKDGTYKGFSLEGYFDLAPERDTHTVEEIVDDLDGQFKAILKPILTKNMSKINRFKAALAKLLAAFGNVSTDKGVLAWDGDEDLKAGDAVFIEDQEGNRTDAPDGDYVTTDAKTIVVADGKVAEIRDPEAEVAPEEPAQEPEQTFGRIATDNGELVWEGEGDLDEGAAVFVEGEEGLTPAPDGEYRTEDGKIIVVVEGRVAEIRDPEAEVAPEPEPAPDEEKAALRKENAELRSQVETLTARVAELSRMPAAKPAHEEVKETETKLRRTGNKGLDRIAALMSK
jgi:ketosteroid isomerase-like protein